METLKIELTKIQADHLLNLIICTGAQINMTTASKIKDGNQDVFFQTGKSAKKKLKQYRKSAMASVKALEDFDLEQFSKFIKEDTK